MVSAFHGGRSAFTGGDSWLHYAVKDTPGFSVDSPGPKHARPSVKLKHGTVLVLDYLSMSYGYAKIGGGFDVVMVPYRQPLPPRPSADHKDAIQLAVLVGGHGLLRWTITSTFLLNTVKLWHEQYEKYPEAVEKKLPANLWFADDPHEMVGWPGDKFFTPAARIGGWDVRDEEIFGPQTVREPLPMLGDGTPPVALPSPDPVPTPPPAPPAPASTAAPLPPAATAAPFNGGVPYRPIPAATPPVAPAPAALPGASAANELLARYARKQS